MSALKVEWRFWDPSPEDRASTLDRMLEIARELGARCTCKPHSYPRFQGRIWVLRQEHVFPSIWMLDHDRLVGIDYLHQPVVALGDQVWRARRRARWVYIGCQCTASAECQEKMMGLFLPITRTVKRSALNDDLELGLRATDHWRRKAREGVNDMLQAFRRHPNER